MQKCNKNQKRINLVVKRKQSLFVRGLITFPPTQTLAVFILLLSL